MKLRTITIGINLEEDRVEEQVKKAGRFARKAKDIFEDQGCRVQTLRLTTQPWETYYRSEKQMKSLARKMSDLTRQNGIDYFSLGTTSNPERIPLSVDLIADSVNSFCTAMTADECQIYYRAAREAAAVIKQLAPKEHNGFANLRFAAISNIRPGCPFFPASYHAGTPSFAIGMENSDLVARAFSKAGGIEPAEGILQGVLDYEFQSVERIAVAIADKSAYAYGGLDVSIAPSVNRKESLAFAFEKLGLGKFGEPGTLIAAGKITECLKNAAVKTCGYSGLMLPVLEDYGLALRNTEGKFDIMRLLQYSSICGTGLDTIPLSGDVSEKALYALLLDIAALAVKLHKPLSARLMPVPGKKAGEMTTFDFEYFVNSRIMDLR